MTTRISPRTLGRCIGLLFLLTIVCGVAAQAFISERLIDFGNSATTATNILANKDLFRIGFVLYLLEMTSQITCVALWYKLLRPVNPTVALVAAFIELGGAVVKTAARMFFIAPLFVLNASEPGSAAGHAFAGFSTEQLHSITLLLLRVNDDGAATALAMFGFSTVLNGYLIFRSGFMPRWIGAIGFLSGFGWLMFLYPPLGRSAFMVTALVGLLSSATTIIWLLFVGVDQKKWQESAAVLVVRSDIGNVDIPAAG